MLTLTRKPAAYAGLFILISALVLASCEPNAPTPASTAVPPTAASSATPVVPTNTVVSTATQPAATPTLGAYTDPFAYCTAIGGIDKPDARFKGEQMPEPILDGLMTATGAAADAKEVVRVASSWRCMEGKVYACWVGANLPCDAKANVDKTPIPAELDFCSANPDSLGIPAVVTGHETIYNWVCKGSQPAIDGQGFHVDPRGFIAEIWYPIAPPK